jgi:hypothetical protein
MLRGNQTNWQEIINIYGSFRCSAASDCRQCFERISSAADTASEWTRRHDTRGAGIHLGLRTFDDFGDEHRRSADRDDLLVVSVFSLRRYWWPMLVGTSTIVVLVAPVLEHFGSSTPVWKYLIAAALHSGQTSVPLEQ